MASIVFQCQGIIIIIVREKRNILIVEDNDSERMLLSEFFKIEDLSSDTAKNGKIALEKMEKNDYNLIITDLIMTDHIDGMYVLDTAQKKENIPEVIIITGFGSIDNAVNALKLGAFDYISKPLDLKKILKTANRALERKKNKPKVENIRDNLDRELQSNHVINTSTAMKKIFKKALQVSKTNATILIDGESGTGKEVVAQYIHKNSNRSHKPFITVNCAALPETLLESELFGHTKGAFTGAINNKKGLFEEAHKGTILLDEIGEIPLQLQSKLLRVLQDGEIRKIGANKSLHIDTRIIASTNKDLKQLVLEHEFREDLYYRIKVIPITLPPLRERKDAIIPLANYFFSNYMKNIEKNILGFSNEAQKALIDYNWPGNIRELKNSVEAALIMAESEYIKPLDILPELSYVNRSRNKKSTSLTKYVVEDNMNLHDLYDTVEKEYIQNAIEENQSNLIDLAKNMGISRSTLWRKMDKYRIKSPG